MKLPLDFTTPNESFNVHAYDKRADMALVELCSDFSRKPYRILLGFGYDVEYEWASQFYFGSIKEAFEIYDGLLSKTLLKDAPRAEGTI